MCVYSFYRTECMPTVVPSEMSINKGWTSGLGLNSIRFSYTSAGTQYSPVHELAWTIAQYIYNVLSQYFF